MDIKLYCNSNCQSSRGFELISRHHMRKPYISIVQIPDSDLKLTCDEFANKYGTPKFPFAIVDKTRLVSYNDLTDFMHYELIDYHKGQAQVNP